MTLDDLHDAITGAVAEANLVGQVSFRRVDLVGIERLVVERVGDDGTRYLRITPVPGIVPGWDFEILGGLYRRPDRRDDFDGRRGGSSAYTLGVVRTWLIDLGRWEDIKAVEAER
jgi:hypothetical protein